MQDFPRGLPQNTAALALPPGLRVSTEPMNDVPVRRLEPHTPEEAALLQALGARMRTMRARRAMTQRALSVRSGVSERYIAQFEAGGGNVSMLVLHRIGRALGVPVAELVADQPEPRAELALLHRMLGGLDDTQLAGARRVLGEWLGQPSDRLRRARVALIGLRGAGKSSLGRMLAAHRGVRFVELDHEVERQTRMELRDIFEMHGQDGFRRLERQTLEQLLAGEEPMVLAAGGGIVAEAATFELLLSRCRTVWVRAAPEEHMQRVVTQGDERPMRDNHQAMDDLRAILASREALYAKADLTLDNQGRSLEASLDELIRRLDE
jgi:XRE family aerobic/anaerobic benzoate catabolism transcriptional regulator